MGGGASKKQGDKADKKQKGKKRNSQGDSTESSGFPDLESLATAQREYGQGFTRPPSAKQGEDGPQPFPTHIPRATVYQPDSLRNIDEHAQNTPLTLAGKGYVPLVKHLTKPAKNQVAKVRAIFVWIASQSLKKVTSHLNGEMPKRGTPLHSLLVIMTKGWQGLYSTMFVTMCKKAGILAREVRGKVKGSGYHVGDDVTELVRYAVVCVDDVWRFVDQSWGSAGTVEAGEKEWERLATSSQPTYVGGTDSSATSGIDNFWFLTDPEVFVYTHYTLDEGCRLLARDVTEDEFKDMTFIHQAGFDLGLTRVSEPRCILTTDTGHIMIELQFDPQRRLKITSELFKSGKELEEQETADGQNLKQFVFLENMGGLVRVRMDFARIGRYKIDVLGCDTERRGAHPKAVCTYIVDCTTPSFTCEPYPDNEREEWGPGAETQELGLEAVDCEGGKIMAPKGEAEIRFRMKDQLKKEKLSFYHTIHSNDVGEEEMKSYTRYYFEDDDVAFAARFPQPGKYIFRVFAKQDGRDDDYHNVCNYLVVVDQSSADLNKFPDSVGPQVGARTVSDKWRLDPYTHKEPLVECDEDGTVEIVMTSEKKDLYVTALLERHNEKTEETEDLSDYVMCKQLDNKHCYQLQLRFLHAGIYNMDVQARPNASKEVKTVYQYVISVPQPKENCLPFPKITAPVKVQSKAKHASVKKQGAVELLEPSDGYLFSNTSVLFKARTKYAKRVYLVDEYDFAEIELVKGDQSNSNVSNLGENEEDTESSNQTHDSEKTNASEKVDPSKELENGEWDVWCIDKTTSRKEGKIFMFVVYEDTKDSLEVAVFKVQSEEDEEELKAIQAAAVVDAQQREEEMEKLREDQKKQEEERKMEKEADVAQRERDFEENKKQYEEEEKRIQERVAKEHEEEQKMIEEAKKEEEEMRQKQEERRQKLEEEKKMAAQENTEATRHSARKNHYVAAVVASPADQSSPPTKGKKEQENQPPKEQMNRRKSKRNSVIPVASAGTEPVKFGSRPSTDDKDEKSEDMEDNSLNLEEKHDTQSNLEEPKSEKQKQTHEKPAKSSKREDTFVDRKGTEVENKQESNQSEPNNVQSHTPRRDSSPIDMQESTVVSVQPPPKNDKPARTPRRAASPIAKKAAREESRRGPVQHPPKTVLARTPRGEASPVYKSETRSENRRAPVQHPPKNDNKKTPRGPPANNRLEVIPSNVNDFHDDNSSVKFDSDTDSEYENPEDIDDALLALDEDHLQHEIETKKKVVKKKKDTPWRQYHDVMLKNMALERLRAAVRTHQAEHVDRALAECEHANLDDTHPDVRRAIRAKDVMEAKQSLQEAVQRGDASAIRDEMNNIKNNGMEKGMQRELQEAGARADMYDRMGKQRRDVLDMDKYTMSEIRRYQHPPPVMHRVMQAAFLLLGEDEETTLDWKACQKLCNPSGPKGLNSRMMRLEHDSLHPEITARSREILEEYGTNEILAKSSGACTFYVWAKGVLDEPESEDATPATIQRQKEILGRLPPPPPRRRAPRLPRPPQGETRASYDGGTLTPTSSEESPAMTPVSQ